MVDYIFLITTLVFLILISNKIKKKSDKKHDNEIPNELDQFKKNLELNKKKKFEKKELIRNIATKKYEKPKNLLLNKVNDIRNWHEKNFSNTLNITEGPYGDFGGYHIGISNYELKKEWSLLFNLDPVPDLNNFDIKSQKFSIKIHLVLYDIVGWDRIEKELYFGNKIDDAIKNFLESYKKEHKSLIGRSK